ncbi:hypothetical protein BH10ACT11_BH10ACT11_20730 [soil metagenome]
MLVVSDPDPGYFVRSGQAHNQLIRRLLVDQGVDLGEPIKLLDLACGCGRVARWWSDLESAEVHGCDYNSELVAWVQENLPSVAAACNDARPPLPYADDSFDLLYALSFFTHLDGEAERAWSEEMARVLKPGGIAVITTMGERYTGELDQDELLAFRAGERVVHFGESEGSNLCATYHPPAQVERGILADFEVLDRILTAEPSGRESAALSQDVYVARLTDSVAGSIE